MDPVLLLALCSVPALALQLRAMRLWDELVEALWTEDRPRWEAIGRPIGFFWRPEEPKMGALEGIGARRRLQWSLAFGQPDWFPTEGKVALKMMGWRMSSMLSAVGLTVIGLGAVGWTYASGGFG